MKENYERLMPGVNNFIPGVQLTSFFPDPIEISFVGGGLTFTPGVPTEDGWYVVKSQRNEYTFYETIIMSNGMCVTGYDAITILSHAKLPEL